jgi:Secretion system C-terminal sorting domain
MMKKFTVWALFATLLSFSLNAQNPNNFLNDYNAGFEGFDAADPTSAYWWNTKVDTAAGKARGKFTYTTVNPKEGARCARAEVTAVNPGTQWHIELVQYGKYFSLKQLKANNVDTQFYTIRFWARTAVAGSKFNVLVQKGAPNYETPFERTITGTTAWTQYTFDCKVPDGDYHPLFHLGVETGTFFIDYVEFGKKGELDAVAPADKNLMKTRNPSFEDYTAAEPFPNWFIQVDSSGTSAARGSITNITDAPKDGTRCLKAVVTATQPNEVYRVQAVHNPFNNLKKLNAAGTGDQSYSLQFWAKSDVAGKKITAIVQNAAFGTVATPASQDIVLTTSWAQYQYTFTISKDEALRPVVFMGVEKGTFFLDGFEFGKTEDIVTTPIVLPKNFMVDNNPEFEVWSAAVPFDKWFVQVDSSATSAARGSITNENTGAFKGTRCLKAVVTVPTPEKQYQIQATHNLFYPFKKLKAGTTTDQSYTLSFYAKADAAGRRIGGYLQNSAYQTAASPGYKEFTLTANWARYVYTFTVTKDDQMQPNIHMAYDKGTIWIDNFELGKTEDIISGTNEIIINNNVLVYPNPTSGAFQISSPEAFESLEIFDLTGKMLQRIKGNTTNQYDVSNLPNGIYQLAARSKEGISVSRIVKM